MKPWIPVSAPNLAGREREYVLDCVDSTWISSKGPYLERFEKAFASYLGVKHAIALCNGTAAVHVALLAAGVEAGDEVIVPTLTFIATVNAVAYIGARPVFVDSEPETGNMDPRRIEAAITKKTKAIVAVHLYGHPCAIEEIAVIAKRRKLALIEDAAEALGSRSRARLVGTFGRAAAFSFFGNKTITTGEGGMIVTDDEALARRARLLKGQGMTPGRTYFFEMIGYNYRMTNIQAAIGLAQLEKLDHYVSRKRAIAAEYSRLLAGVPGLTLPIERSGTFNTYWMYCVLVDKRKFGRSRDELMQFLARQNIETRRYFYPCHTMPPYRGARGDFSVAGRLAVRGLNLPSSTGLSPRDLRRVADAVRAAAR